ncbi:MAG TPA: hypothetical protein VGD10_08960 [Allosphingosinicella sp.]|uniref:hypothetical protein n=1 Tax=Allosphingosinicella sp. TaxID=2823234 RepID=UPI002EDB0FFC
MPPRNPELPEGTDHIINGAMETEGSNMDDLGSGGASSGFVGTGSGDDTGGMSTGTGGGNMGGTTGSSGLGGSGGGDFGGGSGGSGGSGGFGSGSTGGSGSSGGMSGGNIKAQLRDGVGNLQNKAGEQIRAYAETGKDRATSALDDLRQIVDEAAGTIDEKLGSEYGEYARRAADAVAGFADTLRNKEVDELFDDGRNLVRKSPGVALGVAAVVGFSLVRLIKAGMDSNGGGGSRGEREIEFQPDAQLGSTGSTGYGTTGTSGLGATGSTGTGTGSTGGSAGTTTGTTTVGGTGTSGSEI